MRRYACISARSVSLAWNASLEMTSWDCNSTGGWRWDKDGRLVLPPRVPPTEARQGVAPSEESTHQVICNEASYFGSAMSI